MRPAPTWWPKPRSPLTNLTALAAAGYTNLLVMNTAEERKSMTGIWNDQEARYDPYTRKSKPYQLVADESAAVTERLEKLVGRSRAGPAQHPEADQPARRGALQQRQPDLEPERRGPRRPARRQQPRGPHRAA